jgi:hypothetical protein
MQSFSEFLNRKKGNSLAESIVRSGIDAEFFCETVTNAARRVNPRDPRAVDRIVETVYNEFLGRMLGGLGNVLGKSAAQSTFGTKTAAAAGKAASDAGQYLGGKAAQAGQYLGGKAVQAGQYLGDKASQAGQAIKQSAQNIGDNYMQGAQIAQLNKVKGQVENMKQNLVQILGNYGMSTGFTKHIDTQLSALSTKLQEILDKVSQDASLRAGPGGVKPVR